MTADKISISSRLVLGCVACSLAAGFAWFWLAAPLGFDPWLWYLAAPLWGLAVGTFVGRRTRFDVGVMLGFLGALFGIAGTALAVITWLAMNPDIFD